jgi:hypothetical protein
VLKLSLCLIKQNTVKIYRELEEQLHVFLTSALGSSECPALRALMSGKNLLKVVYVVPKGILGAFREYENFLLSAGN